MKILLLNDNPVVTKLVTLSAQKTDNEIEAEHSIDDVVSGEYDLLVIDDALYDEDSFNSLKEKISFKKSLFVCSRENESEGDFSATIKKPFLPTDMVEIFTNMKKTISEEVALNEDVKTEELDDLEEVGESILDNEEAQKVKDLLEETEDIPDKNYDIALDLEDEADIDVGDLDLDLDLEDDKSELEDISFDESVDLDIDELNLEDDLLELEDENQDSGENTDNLEENLELDKEENSDLDNETESEGDLELEDVDEDLLDNEIVSEENLELEESNEDNEDDIEIDNDVLEDLNLQDQIEEAVQNLSEDDLESEIDEDTLLDIATNELDSFAGLNSKDLKEALGESVEDVSLSDEDDLDDEVQTTNSIKALETLLNALKDKDVAASMKGAKITINISFED